MPTRNHPSAPQMHADNQASSASGGISTPCAMGKAIGYDSDDVGGKRRGRCCRSVPMTVTGLPDLISVAPKAMTHRQWQEAG